MTLTDLCSNFDQYEIVEHQMQIDRSFYSISDIIYTDGELEKNINKTGYIHIRSVKNANYLMFIDMQHKLYLCIYQYIPKTKYKAILRGMHSLREVLTDHTSTAQVNINHHIEDDVIDINLFKCTECNSENKLVFTRSKTNPEALETICKDCRTEYVFVPSKYYKLSSKKVIYFKSKESSRIVSIEDNKPKPVCNKANVAKTK